MDKGISLGVPKRFKVSAVAGALVVRGLLTNEEWAFFEPFVVLAGPLRGRPPRDHRRKLDAIFWIARTGAVWRDLPPELGRWNSVFRQFRRWNASGLWNVLLQALADGDREAEALQMVDSTIVRAHHCAVGARGDPRPGARSFARRLLNQDPPADQRGRPAHRRRADDRRGARRDPLFRPDGRARQRSRHLLADRGYDSDAICRDARDRGATPEIPAKRNRKLQHSVDRRLYALRNRIERFINRLKNLRRIATRYNQTVCIFGGFILLGCIRDWIGRLGSA